jgi:hypothetical protein
VAAILKCEQAKIAKLENHVVEISLGDLETLMDIYRVPDPKRKQLCEAHANSDIPRATAGLPPRSEAYRQLVDLEGEASEILSWHSERLPGPLQSEKYMLKQFELDKSGDSSAVIWSMRERAARNRLFTTDPAPDYRVVLSVSSLLRMPGGWTPDLALDQVQHLAALVRKYPRLDLRILPWTADVPSAETDFTVLRFPESTPDYIHANDFTYIEHAAGGQIINETKLFVARWKTYCAAAVDRIDTLHLLTQMARDLNDRLVAGAHAGLDRQWENLW